MRPSDEHRNRAFSRLTQKTRFRNLIRAVVFAGAVGTAWLIGSSAANAYPDADSQVETRSGMEALDGRPVEDNTGPYDGLVRSQQCESEQGHSADISSLLTENAVQVETAWRHRVIHNGAANNGVASTGVSNDIRCHDTAARKATSDSQDSSQPVRHSSENSQGTASVNAGPHRRPVSGAAAGAGDSTSPAVPLTSAMRSLIGDHMASWADTAPQVDMAPQTREGAGSAGLVAARADDAFPRTSVTHIVARVVGIGEASRGPVVDSVFADADTVAHPVAGVPLITGLPLIAGFPSIGGIPSGDRMASSVTGSVTSMVTALMWPVDGYAPDVLSQGGSTASTLAPKPVAGMPQGKRPAHHLESPVAPDIRSSAGETSLAAMDDAAPPPAARHTGVSGAIPVSTLPVPSPSPAAPGSGVHSGSASGSHVPTFEGGATATVPASPLHNAPELTALFATADQHALRDLAGEPAVSPD